MTVSAAMIYMLQSVLHSVSRPFKGLISHNE